MELVPFVATAAAAGVVALEVIGGGAADSLKRARDRRKPLAEVLPYRRLIADGVLRLVKGRLQVSWELVGRDFAAASSGRYAAYLDGIHQALMKRDGTDFARWQLNFTTKIAETRGYIAQPLASDPTAATLGYMRRKRFSQRGRQWVTRTWLSATYDPPAQIVAAIERFAIEDDAGHASADVAAELTLDKGIRDFEKALAEIEGALRPHVTELRRLAGVVGDNGVVYDNQLRFLQARISGIDHPVVRPPLTLIPRVLAGGGDYTTGFEPRVGDMHLKVIAIEDFPDKSYPGDFDFLSDLELAGIVVWHDTRAIFMTQQEAYARHKKANAELRALSISLADRVTGKNESSPDVIVDPVKIQQAEEQAQRMGEIASDALRYCEWTSGVVLMGRDLRALRKAAARVKDRIGRLGYTARIEGPNAWEANVGLLPGDDRHNRSPFTLDSIQLIDGLHLSHIDPGPLEHPNDLMPAGSPVLAQIISHGRTPVRVVDAVHQVMHVLLMGPTGVSKTTIALAMCEWGLQQYPNEFQYLFDQGGSSKRFGYAHYGSVHALDPSNRLGFNVFEGIEDETIRYERLNWLETVAKLNGVAMSGQRSNRLWRALCVHARSRKRSMSLFQGQLAVFDDEMAAALGRYTVDGPTGYLLDAEHDRVDETRVNVFELQKLMEVKDDRVIGPVILHVLDRMRRRIRDASSKGRIVIDEPKDYFRNPILAGAFESELDKARKTCTGVMIVALRPSDLLSWSIGKTVADGCKTHVQFGNRGAFPGDGSGGEQVGTEYDAFSSLGYTDEDCLKIASLPLYRFLFRQEDPNGVDFRRTIGSADLDAVELAIVGATSTADQALTERLRVSAPDDWQARAFEERAADSRTDPDSRAALLEAAAFWRRWKSEHPETARHEAMAEVAYAQA